MTTLEANPVNIEELADWIELVVLKSGQKGINYQKLLSLAIELLEIDELKFSLATNVLQKRYQLISDYPFKVDELAIVIKPDVLNSPYTLFLLLSRPANLMQWQSQSPSYEELEIFEELVCDSLKNYLGAGSEAIPFGWPSKYGRPENFNAAVKWIAEKMGIQTGVLYRPPRRKDGGVDVFVWRRFTDNRTGFQIGLVQCTLQQNYVNKARDIDLRLWSGWLDLDRDPMTILAIPKAVPGDEQWNEATANSIVFERVRLSQFSTSKLSKEADSLCEKLLEKLRQ